MVNCDWVEKRLSAYIDNELSSQERIAFEAHCDHCNSCRALTAEYQAIGKLMRQSEARVDTTSLWSDLSIDWTTIMLSRYRPSLNLRTGFTQSLRQPHLWRSFGSLQRIQHPTMATLLINTLRWPLIFKMSSAQLSRKPTAAIAKLVAKYQGKELDAKATASYLGYEPAISKEPRKGLHGFQRMYSTCRAVNAQRRFVNARTVHR